ncbi:MAG: amidohydrolase family protein [Gemmatimonadales bacterium]|nr:amidohydrolase family protein [Gemmatimonadales bacterium]
MQLPKALALLLALAAPAAAQVRAFTGARILPVSGPPIDDGVLVTDGARIVAVGRAGAVRVPAGAEEVRLAGKVLLPGLVDTHSHIGQGDGGDASAPMHPDVRVLDAIDVRSDNIRRARAGGITTVNVMPGSGLLLSGQTAYLKLRDGRTLDELLLSCEDPLTGICGGIKMANGTNPRGAPPRPGTRAKAAAIVREKFLKAVEHRAKLRAAGQDSAKRPARDPELEALGEVLDGRRTVHFHTHRHDDILTVLRLKQEFGFRVVLHHVSDAWKVAREIAAAKVPSSVIVLDSPGGKQEAIDVSMENGRALDEAGAEVGFHTDDGITDSRFFLRSAVLAVRAGMSRQKALEALTIAGARMLDVDRRVGTLEAGKDADFVVLSGDPFSTYTHVEQTWVEGRKVFDRADPAQRPYQLGGYGVFNDRHEHTSEWEDER